MSDGVSTLDVAAIRARVDKATPGPWFFNSYDLIDAPAYFDSDRYVAALPGEHGLTDEQGEADAEFIAAARTDVPALLDALAAVEAENAAILDQLLDAQADAQNLTVENARLRNAALAIVENPQHCDVPLIVRMLLDALANAAPDTRAE